MRGCEEHSRGRPSVPPGKREAPLRPARVEAAPEGLDALLRRRDLWRMGTLSRSAAPGISTGFDALDERLPDRGWPAGVLSEVLVRSLGSCEFALVLPALSALTRAGREVALVGPAHLPYAPGLAGYGVDLGRVLVVRGAGAEEHVWAAEQSLRSGACAAVALWSQRLDARAVRRLQLAAQKGRAWGWLFRPLGASAVPSPASLRLEVERSPRGMTIEVRKCRGGPSGSVCELALE